MLAVDWWHVWKLLAWSKAICGKNNIDTSHMLKYEK